MQHLLQRQLEKLSYFQRLDASLIVVHNVVHNYHRLPISRVSQQTGTRFPIVDSQRDAQKRAPTRNPHRELLQGAEELVEFVGGVEVGFEVAGGEAFAEVVEATGEEV